MARWIKWGAIAALVAVSCWISFQWGAESKENEMAQAREKAIREAVAADRRERARLEQQQRDREQEQIAELRTKLEELRERDQAVAEFRASDRSQECGLSDEALELYRRY